MTETLSGAAHAVADAFVPSRGEITECTRANRPESGSREVRKVTKSLAAERRLISARRAPAAPTTASPPTARSPDRVSPPPPVPLEELATICEFAQATIFSTARVQESPGPRMLKEHLAYQHAGHFEELRAWLASRRDESQAGQRQTSHLQHRWTHVISAMKSADQRAVFAACELFERAIRAAYERVERISWLDATTRRMVRRHLTELQASRHLIR